MLSEYPTDPRPPGLPLSLLNQGGRPPNGRPGAGAPRGNGGAIPPPGGVYGILHVIGGNDRGKSHPLNRPETSIGRGADQDCVLADIAVSRRHITVHIEGNRYRMKDLGSGNGSLLNGVKTDTAILNDGDQIEIGNTLLRLEHPPSRAQAEPAATGGGMLRADAGASTMMADAGQFPQVQAAAARPAAMPAPSFPAPAPVPIMDGPGETPSDAIRMPPQRPVSSVSALPPPIHTGAHSSPGGGLLDTPVKKAAVFGTLGLVVLLAGAVVLKKTVWNGAAEAEKAFKSGTAAYNNGEFDLAKKFFLEAKEHVDSPKTNEYIKNCEQELRAKTLLKTAKAYVDDKKYEDAVKAIDRIDQTSALYDDGRKLRKAALPDAVKAAVHDAEQAIEDSDFDTAQTRLDAALALDPDNEAASQMEGKLRAAKGASGKETRVAAREPRAPRAPREVRVAAAHPAPKEPVRPAGKKPPKGGGGDDDDELATVKDSGPAGGGGGTDVLSIKTAAGPYRAKDFAGAATAIRMLAKGEKGKAFDQHTALATRVASLGGYYAKAEADKTKAPSAAITEYQQALNLDATVGKGTHQAYFKQQIGKLAKQAAQSAFQQQKWDEASKNALLAQRFGGDDGGVGAQIKAKANALDAQARALAKSNPNGAKNLWRQVIKMVPASDPLYAKAYQSLNATAAGSKDEDE